MTVLSQKAVARKLNKSTRTIRRWTEAGIIPHKKGLGGRPFYVEERIDKWLGADK